MITSQFDTAPKRNKAGDRFAASLITSQFDTAPKREHRDVTRTDV